MSKVHALYFCKDPAARTWNPDEILEMSDRASIYGDKRTMEKSSNKGMRVPMDVWYGKYWGRIQGNNTERRQGHQNQIPEVYLERVILACSNEGDLVLDPFAGSGTTGTVARAHGRRSIGIEQSEKIAKSAWERITQIRDEAKECRDWAVFCHLQPSVSQGATWRRGVSESIDYTKPTEVVDLFSRAAESMRSTSSRVGCTVHLPDAGTLLNRRGSP